MHTRCIHPVPWTYHKQPIFSHPLLLYTTDVLIAEWCPELQTYAWIGLKKLTIGGKYIVTAVIIAVTIGVFSYIVKQRQHWTCISYIINNNIHNVVTLISTTWETPKFFKRPILHKIKLHVICVITRMKGPGSYHVDLGWSTNLPHYK